VWQDHLGEPLRPNLRANPAPRVEHQHWLSPTIEKYHPSILIIDEGDTFLRDND
jgi:hypothetical protein